MHETCVRGQVCFRRSSLRARDGRRSRVDRRGTQLPVPAPPPEDGSPAGKDTSRPRPGRSAQTEGLGEGTGSEEQGQNGQAIPFLELAESGASWPQGRLVLGRHKERVVDGLLLEADHFGEAQAGQ